MFCVIGSKTFGFHIGATAENPTIIPNLAKARRQDRLRRMTSEERTLIKHHFTSGREIIQQLKSVYRTGEDDEKIAMARQSLAGLYGLAINHWRATFPGIAFRCRKAKPTEFEAVPPCHACRFLFDIPWAKVEPTDWYARDNNLDPDDENFKTFKWACAEHIAVTSLCRVV
jgi:hypothetical protein